MSMECVQTTGCGARMAAIITGLGGILLAVGSPHA
jgi:hypothetical protein